MNFKRQIKTRVQGVHLKNLKTNTGFRVFQDFYLYNTVK